MTRIEKLRAIAEKKNIDGFLISSPSSLTYFSAYSFYFEYGPSPFQLIPALLFVDAKADSSLILADNEMAQAESVLQNIKVLPYKSYRFEEGLSFKEDLLKQIRSCFAESKWRHQRVGIEMSSLPYYVQHFLKDSFPNLQWVDIEEDIERIQSIKDADEIEKIRQSARLADAAQASVMKHARPSLSELELFNRVRSDVEAIAGQRIPLMADLSSGKGTASGGGMPSNKKIESGDIILSDFTPRWNGYWGDSCNSFVVGKPTAHQQDVFNLVKEALHQGIDSIKPGASARSVDAIMRKHIGNYPHHGGHGVGTRYHEGPRIVPYNEEILLPGMLIALEPAIYEAEFGIRLEHLVLVTHSGSETITAFEHRLEQ